MLACFCFALPLLVVFFVFIISIFKVPFREKPRSCDQLPLSLSMASDWLHVAFGRSSSELKDMKLLASKTLSSRQSVVRAQRVLSYALLKGQNEQCAELLQARDGDRLSIAVITRLWDETALRLQMTSQDLERLAGPRFAGDVESVRAASLRKRPMSMPGLTVQSMQQMAFCRWGREKHQAQELTVPMKVIATTSFQSLWNAIDQVMPYLNPPALEEISRVRRAVLLHMFPDGLAGNKLIISRYTQLAPHIIPLEGHCVHHNLQLVWESACVEGYTNYLYQTSQLCGHGTNNSKVCGAIERESRHVDVVLGVPPPDNALNRMILRYTILSPLHSGSYFTQPDGCRFDAASRANLERELQHVQQDVERGLNGRWSQNTLKHHCWGTLPGGRCCNNNKEAREKCRESLRAVNQNSIGALTRLAANKWRSLSSVSRQLGLGVLIHNVLGKGFEASLAAPAEVAKLEQMVQDAQRQEAEARAAGMSIELEPQNAWRVLRGKRTLGAKEFLNDPSTPFKILSNLVGAHSIDRLHATFFECESFAKEHGGRQGGRARVGMLQSMVKKDGILFLTHKLLAEPILSDQSDFQFVSVMADDGGVDGSRRRAEMRGSQLRRSASFKHRFIEVYWRDPWTLWEMLDEEEDEQVEVLTRMFKPQCRKCQGIFIARLIERLNDEPVLSMPEKVQVTHALLESVAEDPMIASMYPVEQLHADSRQALAKCVDRAKRSPSTVTSSQVVGRFEGLHTRCVGKLKMIAPSVKKGIKNVKKNPKTRRARRAHTAHDLFVKSKNRERFLSGSNPGRLGFAKHLTTVHAEWRTMTDEQREAYEGQATHAEASRDLHIDKIEKDELDSLDASPWKMGAHCYSCCPSHLQTVVNELLPEASKSLRGAYDALAKIDDPSQVSSGIIVDTELMDAKKQARYRKKLETCFQKHPGLCTLDPLCAPAQKLNKNIFSAVSECGHSKALAGTMLFLFSGYKRKREARRAQQQPLRLEGRVETVSGDSFALAWMSDQPDKRKRFQYFTHCDVVLSASSSFVLPSLATLQQDRECFVEESGFALSKSLLSGAKYWMAHSVIYREVGTHLHTVEVVGLLKSLPLFADNAAEPAVVEVHDNEGGLIDEACDAFFTAKPGRPDNGPDDNESDASFNFSPASEFASEATAEDEVDSEAALSDREAMPSPESPDCSRDGNKILWRGKVIGSLTQWNNSISASCKMHTKCRAAASRYYPSDRVLVDWLLGSIDNEGECIVTKEKHAEQAAELKERYRCLEIRARSILQTLLA